MVNENVKHVVYLMHVPFEGPGYIEERDRHLGYETRKVHVYRNERLPELDSFDRLVIMGGPMSIHDEDQYPWMKAEKEFIASAIRANHKILGVCLGAQYLALALGARIYQGEQKEIGWFPIESDPSSSETILHEIIAKNMIAFHWHGETFDLPKGAVRIASSAGCLNQGFILEDRIIGLQFHLETNWDGAADLIRECGDELKEGGNYIQSEREILGDESRFSRMHSTMDDILNALDG